MLGSPAAMTDPHPNELRMRAIGKTRARRYVFLVFTIRVQDGQYKIRPIGARYMHQKEIDHYEREIKGHAAAAKR